MLLPHQDDSHAPIQTGRVASSFRRQTAHNPGWFNLTRLHPAMSHSSLTVLHDPQHQRFTAQRDGGLCLLEYRRLGDTLHITHTEVPPALQGRGLAAELVAAMLAEVRAQGWRVRPVCSYVRAYMRRHPETQDLLETP